jgi:hypothetical protein
VVPAGKDGLIIKGKSSIIDSATTGLAGIDVSSSDVSISGLKIRNANGHGIVVQLGADRVEITKVRIQNADEDCIFSDGNELLVANNTLVACDEAALDARGDDVVVSGNTIKHTGSDSIELSGERAVIEKNKISAGANHCISQSGGNPEIVGNTMWNCYGRSAYVTGEAPYVVKNKVVGGGAFFIGCTAACANGLVSGNRVSDTGENQYGFYLRANVTGLLVEKNRAERTDLEAFYVEGDGSVTLIKNLARDVGGDNDEPCYEIHGTGGHLLEGNACDSTPDDGFDVVDGDGHRIDGCKVVNAYEDGIDVADGVTNVTLSDNKVSAGASGIEVGASVTGAVNGNAATGGRVDFCDESAGGVTVTANKFGTTDAAPCASDVE